MYWRLRIGQVAGRLRRGDIRGLAGPLANLIYSDTIGIGVRKDLTGAAPVRAKPPAHPIRKASPADVRALVGPERGEPENADEDWQRQLRLHVLETVGTDRCYVADADGAGPSFMQYLFLPSDNELLQNHFPGVSPVLQADEALVEFLYVAPESRTITFVEECMRQVNDEAARLGAKSIITFVRPDSRGAMLASQVAGFRIYALRHARYRFFRRTIAYEPRPEEMPETLIDLLRSGVI